VSYLYLNSGSLLGTGNRSIGGEHMGGTPTTCDAVQRVRIRVESYVLNSNSTTSNPSAIVMVARMSGGHHSAQLFYRCNLHNTW